MNYPNQLDDKNSLFEVKDLGRTSTSKPLNAVELEIEIDNPVNFPTGRHIVVVESEVIIISHRIDNILYVEKRGAFDTLSENHITNSKIGVVFTSAHYETLRDSIIDIQKEIWTYRKPVNDVLDDPQTIIPVENESYVVGLSPLNEFIGKENNIATWNGTSWDFISPQPAFEMYILNKGKYEFNGTSWVLNKDVEISNVNDLQNQLNNRYTKSENDNLLNTKVDKETGKNLVEDTKVSDYDSHLVNIANPHNVTALQVGAYSKSENDNLLIKKANLDINNKIPLSEIPDSILGQLKYMGVWDFSSGLPTGAQKGNYWITSVSGNGYEVFAVTDFSKTIEQLKEAAPHLVILDIKLPGNNGFEICSQIRTFSDIPIVFVTSSNTDMDELNSIMLGGDAFITKPYNPAILLAKIAALLKKAYRSPQTEIYMWREATLHLESSMIEYKGKKAELTKNELKILYYLFKNAGKICSRNDIVDFLWDNQLYVDDNALSVNITRIRDKLAAIGLVDFIKTKHRQGYTL